MRWSAQRGLPAWIISDGGRHFDNTLLKDLSDIIGFEHHITLPHCPWANGSRLGLYLPFCLVVLESIWGWG